MIISLKKKFIYLFALLAAVLVLTGCAATNSLLGGNSRKDASTEREWGYAENGIEIDVNPSEKLNEYDGQAHTLVMGVFQMADPALFYKLISSPVAMGSALETGKGGERFLQLVRFVVSPGKCTRIVLDRVQHAKYVGVITGYYSIDQKTSSRLFQVQSVISSEGLVIRTYSAKPQKLTIRMDLGAEAIINAQSGDGGSGDVFAAPCSDENSPDNGTQCCSYTLQNIQDKITD